MRQVLFFVTLALIATITITPVYAAGLKTKTTDNLTFQYPSNWKSEDDELNRFSNIEARIVLGPNTVQMNFETGDPIDYLFLGNDESDTVTLATLSEELFNDGTNFEKGSDKYIVNNHTAPYAITTFETEGGGGLFGLGKPIDMVGMVVLVHLSDDKIALVQYVAEEKDFDKYLSKAEKVIESIQPVDGSITNTPTEIPTEDKNGV